MKYLFAILALLGALGTGSTAFAGKSDDAWAKCLWEKVPTSTNNWIGLPLPPKWQNPGEVAPEYALQNRLEAACREVLIPAGKASAPRFNAKAVRSALMAKKPLVIAADAIDPKAYVCERFFLNDKEMKSPAAYRWGYGEDMSKAQLGSMSLIYAAQGSGGVSLPDTGGLEKCFWIQADGSLKDA